MLAGWEPVALAGDGAGGVVWRARREGVVAALKVARRPSVLREIALAARLGRRWAGELLAAGVLEDDLAHGDEVLPRGAPWLATAWVEGEPLADRLAGATNRASLAMMVAHGVGQGLAELHAAGVRHGDVKPANILVGQMPTTNRAVDRGATLVDLDLASLVESDLLHGGTPHYLAPELRAGLAPTPAADLWALGLVLTEILAPEDAALPVAVWASALLAERPGARPSAAWVAARAAHELRLAPDAFEAILDRKARVRRTYLAARIDLDPRAIDPAITGAPRVWLDAAASVGARPRSSARTTAPLDALGLARWCVALVGPVAASWQLPASEAELAERFLALAEHVAPEAWTADDLVALRPAPVLPDGTAGWLMLTRALAAPLPDPRMLDAVENAVAPPVSLQVDLVSALLRRGDIGRAFAAVAAIDEDAADRESLRDETVLLRAELHRRRGETARAAELARTLTTDGGRALLARLAWDEGDLARAERALGDASGPAVTEVRALVAYARGDNEAGIALLDGNAGTRRADGLALARLEGTRGMLEHARGRAQESVLAFRRALDLAMRAGAVVEEATYATGLAAASVDAGAIGSALAAALRGALLWERLDRVALAARAHLSRAAAFALVGATHAADDAAHETRRLAVASGDTRAAAFACWATVEVRSPGDPVARDAADEAARELAAGPIEDRVRAAARCLVWSGAGAAHDDDVRSFSATTRWEWWGARAFAGEPRALAELLALLDVPAPLASRGVALAAGARLARALGDGEAVRRLETARRALASTLREHTPPVHRAGLDQAWWLADLVSEDPRSALGAAQVEELESIVRALSSRDRLGPLLRQVVDTMVLWTGVERGLLLLRAPDDRLVPRAARNLARQDLGGEQLALSTGLARRAMSERQTVLATDAFAQIGDLHASVHALGLRSVLAVPLVARGDVLGVVYLDDRVRRGAFGPGELAWVRLVASQAALAIADARDQALLRRAVRRAERSNARLATELGAREAELATVRAELVSSETRFPYEEIAGRSEPMRGMLRIVDRVTASDVPVLIAGESGTGKELIARAIHRNGRRGASAFVSENCASVPEALLESTLFGHVRGAFTGAIATRAGLFDIADGGTLFLDEIGEMSLGMQTKLLRVLQNGEVRPVGSERSRIVDVRVLGATHRDLEAMVAAGTFREDLFYRLNVVTIRIPALRERRDDIPLLVGRFVAKYAAAGRKPKVTRAAMDRLTAYPWPGNVRQLENEIRRSLVLADDQIDVGELSDDVARGGPAAARDAGLGLKARVDALETELVRDALKKTGGNQTRAAEALGVSRFGLQKMIRRLGITAS